MLDATAKVIRITADQAYDHTMIVSAIQVIGGTATFSLYENTSAVAADLKFQGTAPVFIEFSTPIHFKQLFVDLGAAATAALIHTV